MPKISIIIPVYNVEPYLRQCLDSVLVQSFKDFEVICIDDESTDDSLMILDEYKYRDDRITVISNYKNRGASYSRNIGFEQAKGEYILFLDSDDYLSENAFGKLFSVIEICDVEVISFNSQTVFEGNMHQDVYCGIRDGDYPVKMDGIDCYLLQNKMNEYKCTVWQYLYKNEFLRKHDLRFLEGICHEDILYTFFVHMYAERIMVIKDILHYYRIRNNSVTTGYDNLKKTKSLFACYQKSIEYIMTLIYADLKRDVAIEKHLSLLKSYINKYFYKCDRKQRMACLEGLSGMWRHEFLMMTDYGEKVDFTEEETNFLKTQKKIYIYGAGKYAQKVIFELNRKEIAVSGILVSCKDNNREYLFGYKISVYHEMIGQLDGAVVIPGVSIKYLREVREILSKNPRIYVFDQEDK